MHVFNIYDLRVSFYIYLLCVRVCINNIGLVTFHKPDRLPSMISISPLLCSMHFHATLDLSFYYIGQDINHNTHSKNHMTHGNWLTAPNYRYLTNWHHVVPSAPTNPDFPCPSPMFQLHSNYQPRKAWSAGHKCQLIAFESVSSICKSHTFPSTGSILCYWCFLLGHCFNVVSPPLLPARIRFFSL